MHSYVLMMCFVILCIIIIVIYIHIVNIKNDIKILAIHITNSYVAVYLRMYISHSTDNVITYSIIHKTKQMYVREQLPQEVTILFRVSVYEQCKYCPVYICNELRL